MILFPLGSTPRSAFVTNGDEVVRAVMRIASWRAELRALATNAPPTITACGKRNKSHGAGGYSLA
jgi:phosphopantothenate synthetase